MSRGPRSAPTAPAGRRRPAAMYSLRARDAVCEELGLDRLGLRRGEIRLPGRARQAAAQRAHDLAPQRQALGSMPACSSAAAREVVEHEQRSRRDVMRVGRVVVAACLRRQPLEIPHEVVARDADQPAMQRETVTFRRGLGCARQCVAQTREQRGLVGRTRRILAVDDQPVGVEPVLETVAKADERIARETLATLDAFQQKARPERLELQVGRHRGVEVGGDVERSRRHSRLLGRGDPGDRRQKTHPPVARGDGSWNPANESTDERARPTPGSGATTRGDRGQMQYARSSCGKVSTGLREASTAPRRCAKMPR
jgi:hypothetical protein